MVELVEKLRACFFGCSRKGDARSRNRNPGSNSDLQAEPFAS